VRRSFNCAQRSTSVRLENIPTVGKNAGAGVAATRMDSPGHGSTIAPSTMVSTPHANSHFHSCCIRTAPSETHDRNFAVPSPSLP
jgi:hypothetical protein